MKRTKDGRFIEKRVVVDKILLKEILANIKNKNDFSWDQFSTKLGVCSQMIRHGWLKKDSTIPFSIFLKIEKLYGKRIKYKIKEPFWGQRLIDGKIKFKEVRLPNINNVRFSEFYGILLGDGCIFSSLKGISISGDRILDKDYHERFISSLIGDLFGVKPSIYYSKKFRSINCFLYSKKIAEFLYRTGFPKGLKNLFELKIPCFIYNSDANLSACIRGLMDTDGSLSSHPHSKIMIHLSITNKSLRKDVLNGLKRFGIVGGEFDKGIMIYGYEKIKLFNDKIGFSNKKNQLKYEIFEKTGKVPSSKEVENFIR